MSLPPGCRFEALVTAASKRGTTAEISQLVADTLRTEGITTTLMPIEEVTSVNDYDAVIVGSAIYDDRWLQPARDFLKNHCRELINRMVWLFAAGPGPGTGTDGSKEAVGLCKLVDPLDYKRFSVGNVLGDPSKAPEARDSTTPRWDPDDVRRWTLGVGGAVYVAAETWWDRQGRYARKAHGSSPY